MHYHASITNLLFLVLSLSIVSTSWAMPISTQTQNPPAPSIPTPTSNYNAPTQLYISHKYTPDQLKYIKAGLEYTASQWANSPTNYQTLPATFKVVQSSKVKLFQNEREGRLASYVYVLDKDGGTKSNEVDTDSAPEGMKAVARVEIKLKMSRGSSKPIGVLEFAAEPYWNAMEEVTIGRQKFDKLMFKKDLTGNVEVVGKNALKQSVWKKFTSFGSNRAV
ncbi:hypothetical protein EV361DRAFT_403263 [Lentinula raphanica]|uniref:Uncharacterized protein n=1 Tax=Lentinula raphanica TaxID=153919 RepID=A0AA38P1Z8_9AGAR|nr:hypothetical protein F5878DRAFT_349487 [Lentinula raphanica]KAJ3975921.1 hypothetical protein EV361DRAFT_403263 [Lentinula raphanica]